MESEGRKELIAEMTYEDLPPVCVDAAKILGLETFVNLSNQLGGTSFYVPKFESVIARARDRLIIKQFTGSNYKELALRYNLTEVWVRNIILTDRAKKNQISLFDKETG